MILEEEQLKEDSEVKQTNKSGSHHVKGKDSFSGSTLSKNRDFLTVDSRQKNRTNSVINKRNSNCYLSKKPTPVDQERNLTFWTIVQ